MKWTEGKRKNIRALISSLPEVLWEGAGWTPVEMHSLVQPNDVSYFRLNLVQDVHELVLWLFARSLRYTNPCNIGLDCSAYNEFVCVRKK